MEIIGLLACVVTVIYVIGSTFELRERIANLERGHEKQDESILELTDDLDELENTVDALPKQAGAA